MYLWVMNGLLIKRGMAAIRKFFCFSGNISKESIWKNIRVNIRVNSSVNTWNIQNNIYGNIDEPINRIVRNNIVDFNDSLNYRRF